MQQQERKQDAGKDNSLENDIREHEKLIDPGNEHRHDAESEGETARQREKDNTDESDTGNKK